MPSPFKTSRQFRLTIELIAISIIGLSSVSVWAVWKMEQTLITSHKQLLEYVAMCFPEQVEMYLEMGEVNTGIERTTNKLATAELTILVQSNDGKVLAKSSNNPNSEADPTAIVATTAIPTTPQVMRFGDRYLVICGNELKVNGKIVGKVYLSQDITNQQRKLTNGLYGLVITSTVVTLILIGAIA